MCPICRNEFATADFKQLYHVLQAAVKIWDLLDAGDTQKTKILAQWSSSGWYVPVVFRASTQRLGMQHPANKKTNIDGEIEDIGLPPRCGIIVRYDETSLPCLRGEQSEKDNLLW